MLSRFFDENACFLIYPWRYTEKGIGETLIGMISRCEILNHSVIIKA